jgi:putative intracellular protease/amidase
MNLQGLKIAILVEQQYQELEIWYPHYRLKEAGATSVLVGPEAGKSYPSKLGYPAIAEKSIAQVTADEFDGAILPGGFAPDFKKQLLRNCKELILIVMWLPNLFFTNLFNNLFVIFIILDTGTDFGVISSEV